MALLLYDLLLILVALAMIPWYLLRRGLGLKARSGLRERLGWYAPHRLDPVAGRRIIWIHAVSVGETRAAIPLLKALRQTYPKHALILTNVTETGHAIARGIREVDLCLFFPLDATWVVRRVMKSLDPHFIVVVETEIWPNLVRIAAEREIPLFLVNGRISDRSFPRYLRFKGLLAPVLQRISAFCMQSAIDVERICQLGAPAERVTSTGNLKFDMPAALPQGDQTNLRQRFRLPDTTPVLVAGSTHEGEEQATLAAFRGLLDSGRELVLTLVPRHPERAATVAELLRSQGFTASLRSRQGSDDPLLRSGEILLVDTLGEMIPLYAASDIVFVGGSLIPVGGHNILEAALVKKPVIFGPHMHNFREISQLILAAGAGYMIASIEELTAVTAHLLDHPSEARTAGEAGYAMLAANAGATAKTLAIIQQKVD